ncbi:MAG: hypothetical protein ACRC11_11040 [Xenococcaceae cyanobacterium]
METNDFLAEVYELEDEAWGSFSISLKEEDDVQNRSFIPLYIPLKRAKNCTKGKACGNGCISVTKNCKEDLPSVAVTAAKSVATKAPKQTKKKGKVGTAPPNSPSPSDGNGEVSASGIAVSETPPKTVTASLFAQSYNPNAIPDITPQNFKQYLLDIKKLADADNKDAIHNQSYESAKKNNPSLTKTDYKLQLISSVNQGFVPSDEVLKDLKLTKKQQQQLEQNKKDLLRTRQEVDKIKAAIDYPLMSDEEKTGYKPMLEPSVAEKYVDGSYTGNISFFHGNRQTITDNMTDSGIDPELNNRGIFGKGAYFSTSREVASTYAYHSSTSASVDAGIIEIKAKVKNPYIAKASDIANLGSHFSGDQSNNVDSTAVSEFLRAKGHDSIYLSDYGYLVTFDRHQTVTINNSKIAKDSKEYLVLEKTSKSSLTISDENAMSRTSGWKELSKAPLNSYLYEPKGSDDYDDFDL